MIYLRLLLSIVALFMLLALYLGVKNAKDVSADEGNAS